MTMRTPPHLCSATNDIGKDIRCGPGIRIIYQAIYLIICSIVDAEALFDELLADVCRQIFS